MSPDIAVGDIIIHGFYDGSDVDLNINVNVDQTTAGSSSSISSDNSAKKKKRIIREDDALLVYTGDATSPTDTDTDTDTAGDGDSDSGVTKGMLGKVDTQVSAACRASTRIT
jgi:hypothetical protein